MKTLLIAILMIASAPLAFAGGQGRIQIQAARAHLVDQINQNNQDLRFGLEEIHTLSFLPEEGDLSDSIIVTALISDKMGSQMRCQLKIKTNTGIVDGRYQAVILESRRVQKEQDDSLVLCQAL